MTALPRRRPRAFPRAPRGLGALLAALVGGCGDGRGAEAPPSPPPAPAPAVEAAPAPPRGEREVIGEEEAAEIATQALEPRDTPLALGAKAPRFDGYPEKARVVLVFLRGSW